MTGVVWVRTVPTLDDYTVQVDVTDDVSFALNDRDDALAYALHIATAAGQAEFDAAVLHQLKSAGDDDAAAQTVVALRNGRPLAENRWPLCLRPGVSIFTGEPFLVVTLISDGADPVDLGQWSVEDARSHASSVLDAVVAADLDQAYYRHLVDVADIPEETARRAVDGLATHRADQS